MNHRTNPVFLECIRKCPKNADNEAKGFTTIIEPFEFMQKVVELSELKNEEGEVIPMSTMEQNWIHQIFNRIRVNQKLTTSGDLVSDTFQRIQENTEITE